MKRASGAAEPSRLLEHGFRAACLLAVLLPVALLLLLLLGVAQIGLARLDWGFLTSFASREPEQAGILAGASSAAFISSRSPRRSRCRSASAARSTSRSTRAHGRLARVIEVNIANLAGVPSIIYGLLGLELFVRALGLGRSCSPARCTLALLVHADRDHVRARGAAHRAAAHARGRPRARRDALAGRSARSCCRWRCRACSPARSSRSRARIGETAPLDRDRRRRLRRLPARRISSSPFTALPIQIFNWVSRPQLASSRTPRPASSCCW